MRRMCPEWDGTGVQQHVPFRDADSPKEVGGTLQSAVQFRTPNRSRTAPQLCKHSQKHIHC